jgi:hypothetical protein
LSLAIVGGPEAVGVVSVVVDVVSVVSVVSVGVVSVDVVSVVGEVSVGVVSVVVVSVDVVSGSEAVVVSVDVESDSTASGPAPETTPAVVRPTVKIATRTNVTRSRRRPREAAVRSEPIPNSPFGIRRAASPRRRRIVRRN